MANDLVRFELHEHVAQVTIDRPESRNALNPEAYRQLEAAFRQAQADPEVRCVLLTGADPSFCSGDDVKEIMSGPARDATVAQLPGSPAPEARGDRGARVRPPGGRRGERSGRGLGHGSDALL